MRERNVIETPIKQDVCISGLMYELTGGLSSDGRKWGETLIFFRTHVTYEVQKDNLLKTCLL